MKKLFLLLTAGMTAMGASAQLANTSMVKSQQPKQLSGLEAKYAHKKHTTNSRTGNYDANKTTTTYRAWWSFNDANNPGTFTSWNGTTGNIGFVPLTSDSNAYVPAGPFYWWCHGQGTSFDPHSGFYDGQFQPPAPAVKPGPLQSSITHYWVDSIYVEGFYDQQDATQTDTLFIDVTYASDTDSWNWVISNALVLTYGITGGTDTTYGMAQARYNPARNAIASTVPHTVRITKLLNSAAAVDTMSNGISGWAFPVGLKVPKARNVVAYAHFEPQTPVAFGTDLATINKWYHETWDFTLPYLQETNDFSSGLISSSDERHATANAWTYTSKPILAPSYVYTAPLIIHNPYFVFNIRQDVTAVDNVAENIKNVSVSPNPATSHINVSFNVTLSSDVTVTLTNVMGQQVATQTIANTTSGHAGFDVTSLANGVYIYTISANGQQTSGRVVVAH